MRILCLCFAFFLGGSVWAESELEPSLGIAFPLDREAGMVVCAEDVLLNRNTFLPKGTALLTAFIPPKPEDKDVKRKNAKVDLEKTFSRKKPDVTNSEDNALERAMLSVARERALRIQWNDPDIFRGWFHKQPAENYYIVYRMGEESEPRYAKVEFLDGMFLIAREDRVTVAGVIPGSRSAEAGLKAGDQILSLNGTPFDQHVREFFKVYLLMNRELGKKGKELRLGIMSEDSSQQREVTLSAPYSLNTNPFE
jgi:hypothetical protein